MFHIAIGVVILTGLWFDAIAGSHLFFIALGGTALSIISHKVRIPIIYDLLIIFDRPQDRKNFPGKGAIFFFYGTAITAMVFSRESALAGIAILTFGDSFSHIVGRFFGTTPFLAKHKLIEGSIAGMILGGIAASAFVPVLRAFPAAIIAMTIESIDIKINKYSVDDNLIVPIVGALVVEALLYL